MIACGFIAVTVYFVCHLYLDKMSHESLQNWLQSEKVDIQQGNLLGAITKNQRVLTSSEFIKGVSLIDLSLEKQNTLINFGENIDPVEIKKLASDEIAAKDIGVFKQIVVSKIPGQPDLAIAFHIDGRFLRIIFMTASFGFIFIFVLASAIIFMIQRRYSMRREKQLIEESKGKLLFAEMASRVAHDIRSPMGVLSRITDEQLQSRDARDIITKATERLQNITDDLIKYWKQEIAGQQLQLPIEQPEKSPVNLKRLVSELISEKRKFHQHLDGINFLLSEDSMNDVLPLDGPEFSRHLSNIADNAVDAVGLSGDITFRIFSDETTVRVEVVDTGCGIPAEILPQIGRQKLSLGKSNGTGHGVYYARKFIKSLGGELKIQSVIGSGSTFTFMFPKSDRFLFVPESKHFVYVDDDSLTHGPWLDFMKKNIFTGIDTNIFKTSASYLSWAESAPKHILFSDFNLKDSAANGLEVIARASDSADCAYLITNSYDDPSVQHAARKDGVYVVPKNKLDEFQIVRI